MRRPFPSLFILALCLAMVRPALAAAAESPFTLSSRSAILMEAKTGKILFAQDEHAALAPASVTKLMAMLLVMEAVDSGRLKLSELVTASPEACRMGGSQIWLEEGEQMTVADLMKAVAIVSANDATVALAEHLAGSEENFVRLMNERARELGMKDTVYVNATGLTPDDPAKGKNLTSACDQAILAREMLRHPAVLRWTGTWIDYVRDGQSFLRNTNNLVRFYEGCDGLKTGFTDEAGFCLVATAKRAGLRLIAVVMKAPTAAARSAEVTKLFNYGFSRLEAHMLYREGEVVADLPVVLGRKDHVPVVVAEELSVIVERGTAVVPKKRLLLPARVTAPVKRGAVLGQAIAMVDGRECGRAALVAGCSVPRSGFFQTFLKILGGAFQSLFKRG